MLALDDASDPATGANAATQAVSDPAVVAAAGHWNSPVARATIPIFHENGIPLMIWGAIGTDLTDKYGGSTPRSRGNVRNWTRRRVPRRHAHRHGVPDLLHHP
jgi:ABC-type branched-subunit amino acid transport system substrate-binding protein